MFLLIRFYISFLKVFFSGGVRHIAQLSARKCPFLSGLNPSFLKNYGESLVQTYGDQCPFMKRFFSSHKAYETVDKIVGKEIQTTLKSIKCVI